MNKNYLISQMHKLLMLPLAYAILAIVVLVWFSPGGGYEPPDHERVGQLRPIENVKTLIFIPFEQLEKQHHAHCDYSLVYLLLFELAPRVLSRKK